MNSKIRKAHIWFSIMLGLLLATPMFAQSTTGYIAGMVKDSNGAAVPGATVTVANPANNITQTTTSAEDGGFKKT